MTSEPDVDAAVQRLADNLAQEAIGSIDYAVNAKAIALAAPIVSDKLRSLLASGYKLKDISPLVGFGSFVSDFRLRFHLETDNIIDLPTGDFIASVDLATKRVKRILDPNTRPDTSTINVPFSLAVPSLSREFRTPLAELTSRFNRARVFFTSRSLGPSEDRLRRMALRIFAQPYTTPYGTAGDTYYDCTTTTTINTTTDTNGVSDNTSDDVSETVVDHGQDSQIDQQHDDFPA